MHSRISIQCSFVELYLVVWSSRRTRRRRVGNTNVSTACRPAAVRGRPVTAIRQIIGAGHVVGRPGVKLVALTLAADVTLCGGGARDVIDHRGMHV